MRTVFELLASCKEEDQQRILRKVTEREPNEVAELLDTLVSTRPVVARQLTDLITTSAATRVKLMPISIDRLDPRSKEQMFASLIHTNDSGEVTALLRKLPDDDAKLLMFLAVQAGKPALASIVDEMATDNGRPALANLLDQPLTRLATLIHGLRTAHFEQYALAVLDKMAASDRGVHAIVQDVAFLFSTGQADTGKLLLDRSLKGCSNTGLTNMVSALRQQDQLESLAAAAEWVKETYAQIGSSNIDGILRQIGLNEYTSRSRGTWLNDGTRTTDRGRRAAIWTSHRSAPASSMMVT